MRGVVDIDGHHKAATTRLGYRRIPIDISQSVAGIRRREEGLGGRNERGGHRCGGATWIEVIVAVVMLVTVDCLRLLIWAFAFATCIWRLPIVPCCENTWSAVLEYRTPKPDAATSPMTTREVRAAVVALTNEFHFLLTGETFGVCLRSCAL